MPHVRVRRCGAWFGLFVLVFAAGGCGDKLRRQEIKGTVNFKKQPVVIGQITFTPVDGGPTVASSAIRNGKYEVAKTTGLSPGKYNVRFQANDKEVIAPPAGSSEKMPDPPKNILQGTKHEKDGTHVVEVVDKAEPNVIDFDLE